MCKGSGLETHWVAPSERVNVVIIGAGFGGIGVAYYLKQAGVDSLVILESASEVGGTWYHNKYPGCACDTSSILYSYSFKQNAKWTKVYPNQPEILQYVKDCVVDLKLTPYLRLNHKVQSTAFDSTTGLWTTRIHNEPPIQSNLVIACSGTLAIPRTPDFPGRDSFAGPTWHSALWNHDYNLAGKRVALVGTGQSAIQIVSPLSDVVSHLTVFQRSACHIVPRNNWPVPRWLRELYAAVPLLMYCARGIRYWLQESVLLMLYQVEPVSSIYKWRIRSFRESLIPDKKLRAALTPSQLPGSKRFGINDDYYPALMRPNVTLVPRAVQRVVPSGIVDADGVQHDVDVIVYATGFAGGDMELNYEVTGLEGVSLGQLWGSQGATAYYGGCVSGFPNFYMIHGPNTFTGHGSAIHVIESQSRFVVGYVRGVLQLVSSGASGAFVDVMESAQIAYNNMLDRGFRGTVYHDACTSWYKNKQGKNVCIFPDGTYNLRKLLSRSVGWEDFNVAPESANNKVWNKMQQKKGVQDMQKVMQQGWTEMKALLTGAIAAAPVGVVLAMSATVLCWRMCR